MLAEIKALADIISAEKGLDKLEILVQNPKVKSYLHAITIDIDYTEKEFELTGVSLDAIVNINLIHWPSKSDPLALA